MRSGRTVAGIPTGVAVAALGRLRLTLFARVPRFGGLVTARECRASREPCSRTALVPDEGSRVSQLHRR